MTEELTTRPDGSTQIIIRSEFKSEVATAVIRHDVRAEHNGATIYWLGAPLQTRSRTWTVVGIYRPTKPIAIECGDETFEIENQPEDQNK